MSERREARAIKIPPSAFDEYIAAAGLAPRFGLALARAAAASGTVEGACDSSLEIEALLLGPPPTEGLREALRLALDSLGGPAYLRVERAELGPGEADFLAAASAAQSLDSIRLAWARSWSPGRMRGGVPTRPMDALSAMPAAIPAAIPAAGTAAVPATANEAARRLGPRRERASDGTVIAADPDALERALDAVEAERGQESEALRERLVLVRYLIGTRMLPLVSYADPFAFLKLGASATGADGGLGALLERSYALEEAVDRLGPSDAGAGASSGSPGATEAATRGAARTAGATGARQLIGIPSAPGRADGRAVRPEAPGGDAPGGPRPILVCDRYSRGLVEAYPDAAAIVEREGGRIGLGARLARSVGIPCVSGVQDLARIPDGAELMVDGGLGIVTVAARAAG